MAVPRPLAQCMPWHRELSRTARVLCSLSRATKRDPAAVQWSKIAEQLTCSAQRGEDCASGFCWQDHKLIHCATSAGEVTGLIK